MGGLYNILGQILLRRRFGLASLLAGPFLAVLWQIYKRTVGRPITIRTWMGPRFVLRPDSVTSSRFVYEGQPDRDYIDVLAYFSGGDASFVDVGANAGMYSVLLSELFPRAWLFEPNPVAVKLARENLVVNGVEPTFMIVEMAVSDCPGRARFPILSTADPAARLEDGPPGEDDGSTREVEVTTLDLALPQRGEYVLKVDAEGYDCEVLQGATGHLARGGIRAGLFECHTDETLACVLGVLRGFGYRVFDGPREISAPGAERGRDLFLIRGDLVDAYLVHLHALMVRGGTGWRPMDGRAA